MKPRIELTAREITELQQFLDRRLDAVGLTSQPVVAKKLLDLSTNPKAQLQDYANLIKNDQAVAGRVLRLANSAFFAQRRPVTAIDRACVVLGIDRLKAVSLGFHLSRAAQSPGDAEYSRTIWGESLYRACLASEVARCTAPGLVSEAFVVGLMIDAGLPLMNKLIGDPFRVLREQCATPSLLYKREYETLSFTHVDVITALARRWKFPELLAKPLEWHHTKPAESRRDDPHVRLHRIAYVVGSLQLRVKPDANVAPLNEDSAGVDAAQRMLAISDSDMSRIVSSSVNEYGATIDMFRDIASNVSSLDELMEAVQVGLSRAVDDVIETNLVQSNKDEQPGRLTVDGQSIEILREADGSGVAFLFDTSGNKLLSHRFDLAAVDVQSLCAAMGLEASSPVELDRVRTVLAKLAA